MHAIVFDQSPETAFIKCALLEAVGLRCNWFASVKEYKSINKPCDFVCFENNGSASEALGVVNIITHNDNGGQKRPSVVVWTKPAEVILDEWCDVIDDYMILPTSAKLLQKKIKRLANANVNSPGCNCLSRGDVNYNRKFVQKMRSSLSAVKYVLDRKSERNAAFEGIALMQLSRVEKHLQKFLLYNNCSCATQDSWGWVNLRQLLETAERRINSGKQNEVRVDMNLKNRWFVYGRRNLIEAMIEEVLSNALRFAPGKSKIHIKAYICGDEYHLAVYNKSESRWMYGGATKVTGNEVEVEKPFGLGLNAVWRIAKLHNIKTMLTKRDDGVVQFELIIPKYKANENKESVNS